MDNPNILPPIFGELINSADYVAQIDAKVIEAYCLSLDDEESFMPELIGIIGPMAFKMLVCYYGGQSMRIPLPEDILSKLKEHS